MKLIKKTNKVLQRTVTSTLIMCILCIVFLVVCLGGSSWAWFSANSNSDTYTISTGANDQKLTISRLNSKAKMFANSKANSEELLHHQMISEPGSYEISVLPKDGISGYSTLKVTDEEGNELLSKVLEVTEERFPRFVIHTNKTLNISIENINWGALESYDELEEEYYYGEYSIEYDTGIEEYSLLPEGYQELSFIKSDEEHKQYIEDITVDDKTYLSFEEEVEEEKIIKVLEIKETEYKDEEGNVVAHIYPCVNQDNKDGVYDVINNKFYENKTSTSFNRGEVVKHFRFNGMEIGNCKKDYKQKTDHSYKQESEDTILKHPEEADDIINYFGYHFDHWEYQSENEENPICVKPEENIKEFVDRVNPRDKETVVLKAVYKENTNTVIFSDSVDGSVVSEGTNSVFEEIAVPEPAEKEGYNFIGYFLKEEEISVDEIRNLFNKMDNDQNVTISLKYEVKTSIDDTTSNEETNSEPISETENTNSQEEVVDNENIESQDEQQQTEGN